MKPLHNKTVHDKTHRDKTHRVKTLVRVPNWLGDAVMALPAVESVAARDEITVVARHSVADLFTSWPTIVLTRGDETEKLRSAQADRIILFTNSFSSAFYAWRAGIRDRIGYSRHLRGVFLTRAAPTPNKRSHQIDEYLELAFHAGYRPVKREPVLSISHSNLTQTSMVVLCPGAMYGSAKCWPRFTELAVELAASGRRVIVLGSKGERGFRSGEGEIKGVENMIGRTTLAQALDLISSADIVISNDSGMAHAARAMGRRTIVIFGPTEPQRTAPDGAEVIIGEAECAPCLLRTCPIDHRCMKSVTVADVMERLTTHA